MREIYFFHKVETADKHLHSYGLSLGIQKDWLTILENCQELSSFDKLKLYHVLSGMIAKDEGIINKLGNPEDLFNQLYPGGWIQFLRDTIEYRHSL
jgi:hypothetical protein